MSCTEWKLNVVVPLPIYYMGLCVRRPDNRHTSNMMVVYTASASHPHVFLPSELTPDTEGFKGKSTKGQVKP